MRRKYQPGLTLYFRDNVLSVPGYTFEKATPWNDTGSMTLLAEGSSLKDGSSVLAKIAPAFSNGSLCLEREAHILGQMSSSSEALSMTLRMVDFFTIPRSNGDVVVLLLLHPGLNLLGRHFPPSKVNDLLLADVLRSRPSMHGDIYMTGIEEPSMMEELEAFDIMDLGTFLEFAIQATHCLEILHKSGLIHRELRANAFHLNSHSGLVRFVHFGNRAVSLEQFGGPSALVIKAFDEIEKTKVKEALCYLAPEQTGSVETMSQDHRTDLYSIGVLFWTLLVGRGTMPFEGEPMELLHSIVQKRPMPVHEVRRDIPQVMALIVDKLLAKNPDNRYQSAYGLKADLIEAQRRLLASISSVSDQSSELIPIFDVASQDRYMDFTLPVALFGREKEMEIIRNVIRHTSTSFSRHFSAAKGYISISSPGGSQGTQTGTGEDPSESVSSHSTSSHAALPPGEGSPRLMASNMSPTMDSPSVAASGKTAATVNTSTISATVSSLPPGDGLRRVALSTKSRVPRAHAVILVGPPGIGKSSIILANQAKWRTHGLWGQAKFQDADSAPFAALLSCLSSVLRQLMVFQNDLARFVNALQIRLGPQMRNIPLLYQGAPELRDILTLFGVAFPSPQEALATRELRARFQSLVENVFSVLAETRLFALFLDDVHEADESTMDLIQTLINSKSHMLVFMTLRHGQSDVVDRVRNMFSNKTRATWINIEPLSYSAISSLVSRTLHRSRDDVAPLSRFVHAASSGNAFSARNILTTFQRQHHITFNWEKNYWQYDMKAIEATAANQHMLSDPSDLTFLVAHLRELPDDARKYLIWAAFFGSTFKATEVSFMMDWEDSSGSSGSEEEEDMWNLSKALSNIKETSNASTRGSMRGLQAAIAEGWLVQLARDMCTFSHDRYRQAAQAEAESLSEETIAKMSFRIILMMLHETPPEVYRIAEHAKRCLPLLHEHPKREELLEVLIDAGESAWSRGAHELALGSFESAKSLLLKNTWTENPQRTFSLYLRLASLHTWKGEFEESDRIIQNCLEKTDQVEDIAKALRLRSRNHWMRNDYSAALKDTLAALHTLGVDVIAAPTRREADVMFEQVKNEILAVGFDDILAIPHATDPRTDLAVQLLNDAGTNAYWSTGEGFADVIGLTTVQVAFRSGMSPGTALGFFWALEAAAERREMYRFSADLAKLALRIAEKHGGSQELCRAQVLFSMMVSGFDSVHIRANLPRLENALKYGNSAGDRIYTSFAAICTIQTRLFICDHISELVVAATECVKDVTLWSPGSDSIVLATALLNCIRAIGGYTYANSPETAFDMDTFTESEYVTHVNTTSGNVPLAMNWYNSFKVAGLFCLGYVEEAAALGFLVYNTRDRHPNHRHIRYALFFHSLAMIACIRKDNLTQDLRSDYLKQIDLNQAFIRKWLSPSPVNTSTWVSLVDAELASLLQHQDAFKLYDIAVKLAVNNDWLLEEGWGLYLQGCHFVRCGVEGLGSELQRRGIARQSQWGAHGIVNYLTSVVGSRSQQPLKRPIFSSDVAVQTDSVMIGISPEPQLLYGQEKMDATEDQEISSLTASDLASILRWSKDISSDINLSSALQRLTEIATETSGSQNTCVIIAREAGDYIVATSMVPPDLCQVHENPKSIRTISDPLQKAIIQHAMNTKERVFYGDAAADSRFSSEANESPHRSVVCLPIFSNRGQTFGAVYLASRYAFSQKTVTVMTLLCQQASISISNALLFRSVQAGTRENLKMISAQRDALEAARRSREDALKATKIKSNFLASMSHELRTPFSSFYGLLDLLSGTELNVGQSEIVQTAKQSCELLLKIIDSILDYSKLEASAVKLEFSGFPVENIIADCMELLLPMAAKKLDLSFNIEPNVPEWVTADYARIRQVLMNLIGNAVKFTAAGSVRVHCSVADNATSGPGEVQLKFSIQDTGIGLSSSDVDLLFVPFQQADNSSTRRFGGTGLGLSISRQLVKLMGGAIGVQSELHSGSMFWFTIPVKIYDSEESRKAIADVEGLKAQLMKPQPLEMLICSASESTLSLLEMMLSGFHVTRVLTMQEAEEFLRSLNPSDRALDFILLDDQSEAHAEELARFVDSLGLTGLKDTKIIHLYTPTTDSLGGHAIFSSNTPGVVKMTKPPRKARLLQTLAGLKDLPSPMTSSRTTDVTKAIEDLAAAQRTLYGNVLVAEDNEIAQKLLVKQLERYQLNVTATGNGDEAIAQWEAHEPGYFSVALFDHHMPICDGVEAAKKLRVRERKRKTPISLPIVALSADCQESTKQLCLSAGMNAFLSKPLKKSDLMTLLSMFGPAPTNSGS
ncbi:hypothetical protein PLICRDRAFT_695401 [Plicaturopsis crispa FD-325 SS-3]|nr:hypothetical protein PLICRDRAFT_695401 [Plicaturopsis crispa FD-325 SS-3]